MNSGIHHIESRRRWWDKALAYSLSSTIAGVAAGIALGTLGHTLPTDGRVAIVSVVAILAVALGVLELGTRRVLLVQCDHETSQRWRRTHPFRWAIRNGSTLGIGATTRVGFWLWYAVPVGALLVGSPVLSAFVYGTYGFVRGWSVWLLLVGTIDGPSGGTRALWLLTHNRAAQLLTAGALLLVGVAVTITVGF